MPWRCHLSIETAAFLSSLEGCHPLCVCATRPTTGRRRVSYAVFWASSFLHSHMWDQREWVLSTKASAWLHGWIGWCHGWECGKIMRDRMCSLFWISHRVAWCVRWGRIYTGRWCARVCSAHGETARKCVPEILDWHAIYFTFLNLYPVFITTAFLFTSPHSVITDVVCVSSSVSAVNVSHRLDSECFSVGVALLSSCHYNSIVRFAESSAHSAKVPLVRCRAAAIWNAKLISVK